MSLTLDLSSSVNANRAAEASGAIRHEVSHAAFRIGDNYDNPYVKPYQRDVYGAAAGHTAMAQLISSFFTATRDGIGGTAPRGIPRLFASFRGREVVATSSTLKSAT